MARTFTAGAGAAIAAVALLAVSVIALFAHDGGLADGHATWKANRPEAYTVTVTVECFHCSWSGRWHVAVDGGQIDGEWLGDGAPAFDPQQPPTIDALYQAAARQLDGASVWPWLRPTVTSSIRPNGLPHRVMLDEAGVDDEEFGWTIEEFTPH